MSMDDAAEASARIRWLVVGTFSPNPEGKRFLVSPDDFTQAMVNAKLNVKVTVNDRLGAGPNRTFDVSFTKPRSFQLTELLSSIPELKNLRALADDLGSSDGTKRPSPDKALDRIVETVGKGALFESVAKILAPQPKADAPKTDPNPTQNKSAPENKDTTVDQLFSQVGDAPVSAPTNKAVDMFVQAIRDQPSEVRAKPTNTTVAKTARTEIENAVFATVLDILKQPAVSKLEASWRGLKLLVDQCPTDANMRVVVLDTTAANTVAVVENNLSADVFDNPDAIFFVEPADSIETLKAYAAVSEQSSAPGVASIGPKFFGVDDASAAILKLDEKDGGLGAEWTHLRAEESTRWLTVATNGVVLVSEGTGAAKRTLFGSPVWGVAAMVAASYRFTGTFARIIGKNGSLKAGGTYEVPSGREAGSQIPTEALYPVRVQSRLAELGILGMGSGRNTDMLTLMHAPTLRGGEDLVPLSAQILAGRIVRFSQWARDQIPAGSSDSDIKTIFESGAKVFLFEGATEGSGLTAQLADNKQGERGVLITAKVKPEHAGIPFNLAFTLPLPAR